jgi:hypothetical protein
MPRLPVAVTRQLSNINLTRLGLHLLREYRFTDSINMNPRQLLLLALGAVAVEGFTDTSPFVLLSTSE